MTASVTAVAGSGSDNPSDRDAAQIQSPANVVDNRNELDLLKDELARQQQQIDHLRVILRERIAQRDAAASNQAQPSAVSGSIPNGEVASTVPMIPAAAAKAATVFPPVQNKGEAAESPLQFQLGSASITPFGFVDLNLAFRDVDAGSGTGTSFGSIPYRTASSAAANLTELRMSPQSSRLGVRVDATVKGAKVIGYVETDFLGGTGNPPVGNVSVTTNSYPLRLRLGWVDVREGKFEFLGGQSWSLITPSRQGISPLPADVFNTLDYDTNAQLGLVWGRIPEFRMVYHPSEKVALAFALDNAEQYIGGSGGAGTIVLPTNLATAYASQLDNGTTTLGVPNMHPDIIAKIAFDPVRAFHFEVVGIERTFKVYDPLTLQNSSAAGGGVAANFNVGLGKYVRFVANNFWSDGGGRYIYGQAPDLVIRSDGSPSLVHSGSTLEGFEFTRNNLQLFTYYGGVYIQRNVILAPGNGGVVGYGYTGSANSQNRSVQEGTVGFINNFWRNPKYGTLGLLGQYSYLTRDPWFVASGSPKETHMNEVFLTLRYTLPGAPPAAK